MEVRFVVEEEKYAICRLSGEHFGLPVAAVREVVNAPTLTPVPRARSYVEGVINLRGHVLPVVNLARQLGMPEPEFCPCIVVAEWQDEVVGLLVEEVVAVLPLACEQAEGAGGGNGEAMRGVARMDDGRLVVIYDLERLLNPEVAIA